ncbi:hypothetical protein GCM10009530_67000 [Microbispora corallina]|uniref:Integral membrane protein n=1 Tax=Microbispora corallina TaxID=83302 RepID=A0ABQ4G598_9ACTN|nr:hypothetical protein Mco01_52240 [Microbispora corallina]
MAGLPAFTEVAARSATFASHRFLLNLRISSRLTCTTALLLRRPAAPHVVIAAAALFVAYDVALFCVLRRGVPVPHRLRLAADAADAAGWSAALVSPLAPAALIVAPLAMEAALWRGWRALAVPALSGSATVAALLALQGRTGGPLTVLPAFALPALGMLGGLLLSRYLQGRVHERLRQAEAERQAAAGRAELAGRHSVAVGADTALDVLTRTWPLLAVPGEPIGFPLAAWRHALAERTADQADYLGTALLRWEQRHNMAHAELRRDVEFAVAREAAPLLISPSQLAALDGALAGLGLRGRVPVSVRTPRPLGHPQVLAVGPHRVELPQDPLSRVPPFDPGPMVIAIGGIGSLTHALREMDGVPLPVAACLTAVALLVSLWAHRQIAARGSAARPRVLAACLAFGALDAVVSTATMTTLRAGGITRQPYLHFLLFAGPTATMYLRDLSWRWRTGALSAAGAVLAVSVALLSVPLSPADALGLLWPLAFTVGASSLRDLLDEENLAFGDVIEREHDRAVAEGFRRGREEVLRLVESSAAQARDRLRRRRDLIDPVFLPEIERRLDHVGRCLADLRSRSQGGGRSPGSRTPPPR